MFAFILLLLSVNDAIAQQPEKNSGFVVSSLPTEYCLLNKSQSTRLYNHLRLLLQFVRRTLLDVQTNIHQHLEHDLWRQYA
jgi:hypothetical protein